MRRWGFTIAAGMAVIAVAVAFGLWRRTSRGLSLPAELAAARQEGLAVKPGDLVDLSVKEPENAAAPYLKAASLASVVGTRSWENALYRATQFSAPGRPPRPMTAAERKQVRLLLDDLKPSFALVAEAVRRPRFMLIRAWDRPGMAYGDDILSFERLTGRLALRAKLNGLEGRPAEARADLLLAARGCALFRFAVSEGEQDARYRLETAIVSRGLEIAELNPKDPGLPKLLRELVAALGPPPDPRQFNRAQIMVGLAELQGMGERDTSMRFRSFREANGARHVAYWRQLYRRLPRDPLAFGEMREVARLVREESFPTDSFSFANLVTSFVEADADDLARMEARRRMVRAVADVLEVRNRTGKFPETLPLPYPDPFGGSLRYQSNAKGFLVYSVDADGKDDGGAEWSFREYTDLTMRIHLVPPAKDDPPMRTFSED